MQEIGIFISGMATGFVVLAAWALVASRWERMPKLRERIKTELDRQYEGFHIYRPGSNPSALTDASPSLGGAHLRPSVRPSSAATEQGQPITNAWDHYLDTLRRRSSPVSQAGASTQADSSSVYPSFTPIRGEESAP